MILTEEQSAYFASLMKARVENPHNAVERTGNIIVHYPKGK